ncbi:uncharacterized protein LOC126724726 [Quercus robur]|uniref:uncharacterized protein LOC126724726 n=1 Tax=Quercus robur TaxID=38942 RepID=UPI0021631FAF|nr:uncharacterized protein LOC126724726 [Quercus robur]
MSIAQPCAEDTVPKFKRGRTQARSALSFSDDDKVGIVQPHDDALVVTLRVGGYDVRRVLVDQGSGAKIMYLDLYRELNLKLEDLVSYDSPLVGFDGNTVILKGLIRLPVQVGSEVVDVDFIVVDVYSPYTAILARSWLHTIGAVSSTLHLKVKYPFGDHVEELIGSQAMIRQCLVAAIRHQSEGEPLDILGKAL